MPGLSLAKRLLIAAAGYVLVGVFALAFLALRRLPIGFSITEQLILSAGAATPLALAFLWEHLKAVKVGGVEFTLNEVTPTINGDVASAIQDLKDTSGAPTSKAPTLGHAIRNTIEQKDLKLVEVNLRSRPYWWSTRLYLLAALAEEYTRIERLIFVEQDADRLYVGMALPGAVRWDLGRRFPAAERAFREIQGKVPRYQGDSGSQVEKIAAQWPRCRFQSGDEDPDKRVSEEEYKVLVSSREVKEWFANALETESREWKGKPVTRSLCAKILTSNGLYVPLLHDRRLVKVVSRADLAIRIATSVLT